MTTSNPYPTTDAPSGATLADLHGVWNDGYAAAHERQGEDCLKWRAHSEVLNAVGLKLAQALGREVVEGTTNGNPLADVDALLAMMRDLTTLCQHGAEVVEDQLARLKDMDHTRRLLGQAILDIAITAGIADPAIVAQGVTGPTVLMLAADIKQKVMGA